MSLKTYWHRLQSCVDIPFLSLFFVHRFWVLLSSPRAACRTTIRFRPFLGGVTPFFCGQAYGQYTLQPKAPPPCCCPLRHYESCRSPLNAPKRAFRTVSGVSAYSQRGHAWNTRAAGPFPLDPWPLLLHHAGAHLHAHSELRRPDWRLIVRPVAVHHSC